MTTTTARKINIETTAYEGDVAFPEAEHYPAFVAAQLAEQFPGVEIDVSVGLKTKAFAYGADGLPDDSVDVDGIESQVRVDLWDAFCSDGYKDYSEAV
jgi:hypothetical protein